MRNAECGMQKAATATNSGALDVEVINPFFALD